MDAGIDPRCSWRDLLKLTQDRIDVTVRMALLPFLLWGRMCCRAGLPWAPSEGQDRVAPAARDGCRG